MINGGKEIQTMKGGKLLNDGERVAGLSSEILVERFLSLSSFVGVHFQVEILTEIIA